MRTAVYLRNRLSSPVASGGSCGDPYTFLHGVPTDLAHLKVFDCTAYLRMEDRYMDILSPKALRCMFISECDDGPGYSILNLATGKLGRTIHVAFVKSQPAHAPLAPPVACSTSQTSPSNCLEHEGGHQCQYLVCGHHALHNPYQQPFCGLGRHCIGRQHLICSTNGY
jgi:hypothetical protein